MNSLMEQNFLDGRRTTTLLLHRVPYFHSDGRCETSCIGKSC